MTQNPEQKPFFLSRFLLLAIALSWTLLLVLLCLLRITWEWRNTVKMATLTAQISFEKDLVYRHWAAEHGGVYVPVTEKTPPNPHLDHLAHRDITTPDGIKLTLVNPTEMTRQAHKFGNRLSGHRSHITSLNPLHPENAPDAWERKALETLALGEVDEVTSLERMQGATYLRLMRPLPVKESCLDCHAEQGYHLGDQRGGISVAIPMDEHWRLSRPRIYTAALTFALLWLLGGLGIWALFSALHNYHRKRMAAETKLAEQEAFLARIIDQSPFAMWIADAQGLIQLVNPALERLTNLRRDQLVGTYNVLEDPTLEAMNLLEKIRAVFEQGETIHFQHQWTGKGMKQWAFENSAFVDIEATMFPIHTPAGKLSHVVLQWIDITDRKRSEAALVQSEKRFRTLIQNSNDILVILDAEGRECYVSDSVERITGFTPEECLNQPGFQFLAEEDVDRIRNVFNRILAHPGKTFHAEYRHKTKAGGWVYLEAIGANCLEEPAVNGIVLNVRDITRRKEAEQALRASENQFQRIFEILPIGLWLTDKNGHLLRGNARAIEIWGAEHLVGPEAYGIFKARRLPEREEIAPEDWALMHCIREGTTTLNEMLEIDAFDKKKRIILNSTAPVTDENGNILGAIVLNQDITEAQAAEAERQQLQDQIQQARKMESVGRLAGGIAHDFNNMLGVILGHADLLLESTPAADPRHEDLKIIINAAKRSAELTGQLLAFARKQTIAPKIFDINEAVKKTLKMLRRLLGEDIDLAFSPAKNPLPVKLDPAQLDQILANLAVNARDAIAGVGKITIETRPTHFDTAFCDLNPAYSPGDYALLAVTDTGSGMDQETAANIFEPFFTTKATGEGTGLGLATVYGIVKQNHGFISVYSEPGQGTAFHLYLPRHQQHESPKPAPAPKARAQQGTETILLVEDEGPLLELTKTLLERLGYTVLDASSPEEALQIDTAFGSDIHLLLTDVIMPGMSGRELWEALHAKRPALRCLYMSGYTADAIAHRGVLEGDVRFLQKPFTLQQLAEKLRQALET